MQELKRHKIVFAILHPFISAFARWKFCYTYDSLRDVEGPYLLLPNHNLELDPIIVGVAAKHHLYFVASEHLSRKGFVTKLLNYFKKPIYHQKGRAGAHTVKEILKTLRSGTSVCLFPEGNRSFNGQSLAIPTATGKMAKRSGVKLVTYRFEGHYLTQPRWATSLRRGKLRGRLVHVYTPEELQAMTDQEDNDAIIRDLWEDAYETQAREMVWDSTVAVAAPRMPISGAPSRPKIKMPLSTMFSTTPTELMKDAFAALEQFFMVH